MHYFYMFAIVAAAGLIPAFGPPSWVFAVFFRHKYHLEVVIVVLLVAAATTFGRLLLAYGTRRLKSYIPAKYVDNLEYSKELLIRKRKSTQIITGLFVLSPLPSAQLFEAAGLVDAPFLLLGLAFFVGRLFTLSIYLTIAHLTVTNLNHLWERGFTSRWAILFEILSGVCLIALFNMRRLQHLFRKRKAPR